MPIELGARLGAVARQVPPGGVVADIGTDHARLPVWLLHQQQVTRVIATDREPSPLEGARSLLALHGVEDRVDLRLGDGLAVLRPGELSTVVMAGMGGRKMVAILSGGTGILQSIRCLVLQPQREAGVLRRWLVAQHWSLLDEEVVEERGRFYLVMSWRPGASSLAWSSRDYQFGPLVMERGGEITRAWLEDELRHARQNLADMEANSPNHERRPELQSRCRELREVLLLAGQLVDEG
jgi:tRNA (adenine22-N1)-methyltransferase